MKLYAYYFPNWHQDPKNDKWHGTGWTEWEVLKHATPRFEGHIQPKVPLWGYEDESDPKVMEKKINAAKGAGIDGFIFDWYWHTDGPYRKRCLEEGFLGASNNLDLEFAVMWCNHSCTQLHPTPRSPVGYPLTQSTASKELFYEITQYCIDNYFNKPNYIKIDGKPYFSIYLPLDFIKEMGEDGAHEAIMDFERRAIEAGYPGVHMNIAKSFWYRDAMSNVCLLSTEEKNHVIDVMNAQSVAQYSWDQLEDFPAFDYSKVIDLVKEKLLEDSKIKKPLAPTVVTGWDPSPRTMQSDIYEWVGYPFTPIGVNNSPEVFLNNLHEIYEIAKNNKSPFMAITAWNEWTEGNYLEPCEEFGYGMLEAVKQFTDEIK